MFVIANLFSGHFVRKSSRSFPSEEKLQCAATEVIEKRMTIRAAAEYFELARATVSDYVTKVRASGNVALNQLKRCSPVRQIFSPALELQLAEYLKTCSLMSHGLTPLETRKLAFNFAFADSVQVPPNWKQN